jgi:hypothetical protein
VIVDRHVLGFLVHADHNRVRRLVQVQPDHVWLTPSIVAAERQISPASGEDGPMGSLDDYGGTERSCRYRRREMGPADGIEEFFRELGRRGHEPLLAKVTGRVRFDLVEGGRPDRWLVAVDKGGTTVWHKGGPAECTIRADRALFERLCRGEENATAAVLRGALVCSGDVELLFAIQRIFPGPPRDRQAMSGSEGSR